MTVVLSQLASALESGARPKGGVSESGDVLSVGAEHLAENGGFAFENPKRISRAFFEAMTGGKIEPSDILIVKDGATTGKVAFVGTQFPAAEAAVNEHVFRIAIDTSKADSAFVFRFLQSPIGQAHILRGFRGATVGGITRAFADDVRVPLFSLAEQRWIAAVLDKADAIRRKRRESLRLLGEFLRSAFLETFGDPVRNEKGWEVVPLERIAEVQGGLQVSARRATRAKEVPYLRVANVYRDRLDLSEMKNLGVTDHELARTRLQAGDVLVVEGHGNREEIGRSAVWDGSIDPCVHQNHLIRVRLDRTKAEPDFVSAFLNSAGGRRQMFRFGKTTSGLNTISTGNVRRVQMMLPPIDLQHRHRQLRSQVLASNQRITAALREADGLFDSLAQRAFRGELWM